ncbi:MAG: TetR/AcrR family transcriptional regulator [Runella sp.]
MRYKDALKVEQILQAALRLVHSVGLVGLKMSDLAKEAGVATGTVYLYFEDKEQLIQQLYDLLTTQQTKSFVQPFEDGDSLKIKIKKLTRYYLEQNLQNPQSTAFFEQYYRSPFAKKHLSSSRNTFHWPPLQQLIVEGQHQSLLKEVNVDWLVMLICGMLNETASQIALRQQPLTEAEWELTFNVIWDGIRS